MIAEPQSRVGKQPSDIATGRALAAWRLEILSSKTVNLEYTIIF